MKALQWILFAAIAPALFVVGVFALYCAVDMAPRFFASPSWGQAAWIAAEVLVAAWTIGFAMTWFDKLPGAAFLRRPLGSFLHARGGHGKA